MDDAHYLPQVKEQYENYPYPMRDPADEVKRLVCSQMPYLANINHFCFKGRQDFNNGFRALMAGGGTGDATIFLAEQLRDKNAQVVYLDMSDASMEIARSRAAIRKLDNIEWVTGSLLEIDKSMLGEFDYINCSGVLHHLESPEEGLARLKGVLTDNGAIGIMLYGRYGRTGVYQMQELMRLVNTGQGELAAKLHNTKTVLGCLPQSNLFKKTEASFGFPANLNCDIEIVDLLLHSQDRAYTVPQVYELVEQCGLHFVDFASKRPLYRPERFVKDPALLETIHALPIKTQQAVAELMDGSIKKQIFYASMQPDTIAGPDDTDMIPYLYRENAGPEIYEKIKDMPVGVVADMTDKVEGTGRFTIEPYTMVLFKHLSGDKTLKEIFELIRAEWVGQDTPSDAVLMQEFKRLYELFNLLSLMVLRHKSVPPFLRNEQIQERFIRLYNK